MWMAHSLSMWASSPYPIELRLETLGLVAELTGTIGDLAEAEDFDLGLTARTPSISQFLKFWEAGLTLDRSASGTARLRGDLESLTVDDLMLALVGTSEDEFWVEGSVSDLLHRRGLDLSFSAHVGQEALHATHRLLPDLPQDLRDVLDGATRLEIQGRVRGNVKHPVFEDFTPTCSTARNAVETNVIGFISRPGLAGQVRRYRGWTL